MHASLSTISASGTTAWPSTSKPPADASPAFEAPFVAAEHDAAREAAYEAKKLELRLEKLEAAARDSGSAQDETP